MKKKSHLYSWNPIIFIIILVGLFLLFSSFFGLGSVTYGSPIAGADMGSVTLIDENPYQYVYEVLVLPDQLSFSRGSCNSPNPLNMEFDVQNCDYNCQTSPPRIIPKNIEFNKYYDSEILSFGGVRAVSGACDSYPQEVPVQINDLKAVCMYKKENIQTGDYGIRCVVSTKLSSVRDGDYVDDVKFYGMDSIKIRINIPKGSVLDSSEVSFFHSVKSFFLNILSKIKSFFDFGLPLVSADSVINYKNYDEKTQTMMIKDSLGSDLVSFKLLTPLNNKVPRGYQKVAEYEVNSLESLKILISSMEFYDMNSNMFPINRSVDFKIRQTEQRVVYDYVNSCNASEFSNGTKYNSCLRVLIGSHFENYYNWLPMEKVDLSKNEKIIVGLFTNVKKDDKVEWIPTFSINESKIRISEWAVWTEDLYTNLISWWKLDETSGDAIDSLGINNGSVTDATQNSDGIINTGYSFDGASDWINMTDKDSLNITGDMTIGAWVKIADGQANKVILGKGKATGNEGYFLYGSGQKLLCSFDQSSGDPVQAVSTSSIDLGEYVFLVCVYDAGTNVQAWVNGTSQANSTTNIEASLKLSSFDFLVGALADVRNYAGYMDEVFIYNRVLSGEEIVQLYNEGIGLSYFDDVLSPYRIDVNSPEDSFILTSNNVTINITAFDDFALDKCIYNVTTSGLGEVVANNEISCSNATANWEYQTISDGVDYILNVFVNDTSNNINVTSVTFTVDTSSETSSSTGGGGGDELPEDFYTIWEWIRGIYYGRFTDFEEAAYSYNSEVYDELSSSYVNLFDGDSLENLPSRFLSFTSSLIKYILRQPASLGGV